MYQDVYGHQGTNGMKGAVSQNKEDLDCLRESLTDKVGKRSVITIFAFIVLPVTIAIAASGLHVWAMQYVYPHKFASQEAVNDQERRVIVLEQGYKNIAKQLNGLSDIKETNRLILQALKELKQQGGASQAPFCGPLPGRSGGAGDQKSYQFQGPG
jgi:hypothetical protein